MASATGATGIRELKFRAFEKRDDGQSGMYYFGLSPLDISTMVDKWGQAPQEKGIPVMQYTGQKDKNGREIYEGDIVKCGTLIGVVIFWKSMWAIEIKNPIPEMDTGITILSPNSEKNTEVIGNIYENKW